MHTTFPRLRALDAMQHASRSHYLRDCSIDDYPICIAFASCFLRIIVRLPRYVGETDSQAVLVRCPLVVGRFPYLDLI